MFVQVSVDFKLVSSGGPEVQVGEQKYMLNAFVLTDAGEQQVPVGLPDSTAALDLPVTITSLNKNFAAFISMPAALQAGSSGYSFRFSLNNTTGLPLLANPSSLTTLRSDTLPGTGPEANPVSMSLVSTMAYTLMKGSSASLSTLAYSSFSQLISVLTEKMKSVEDSARVDVSSDLATYTNAMVSGLMLKILNDQTLQTKIAEVLQPVTAQANSSQNFADLFTSTMKSFVTTVNETIAISTTKEAKVFKDDAVVSTSIPTAESFSNVIFAPVGASFTDTDTSSNIGGSLKISPPPSTVGLTGFSVYFGADTVAKRKITLVGKVSIDTADLILTIASGTAVPSDATKFWIYPNAGDSELDVPFSFALVNVINVSTPGTFSISSAVAGDGQVVLTWGASSDAATYTIKRGTVSGTYAEVKTGETGTTYTDTGLTNGSTYYYMVTAVNTTGTKDASAESSASPVSAATVPGTFSISVTAGNGEVVLTWVASSGADTYTIKRGTVSGTYAELKTGATGTTYTDTGLTNGTTYYYMVTAINKLGTTNAGAEKSAMPTTPPGVFSITSTGPGNAKVTITWGSSTGATSYIVKRGISSGSYTTTLSSDATSPFVDTTVINATRYYYMVTAVNGAGTKDASAEGTARPLSFNIVIGDFSGKRAVFIEDINANPFVPFGTAGTGVNQFQSVLGSYVDGLGRIYFSDYLGQRIARVDDQTGTNWVTLGTAGTGAGQFQGPWGMNTDSQERIYVANWNGARIVRFDDMTGSNWVSYGSSGNGVGQFSSPGGIAIDSQNRIYISDYYNHLIVRIDDMTGANWTTLGTNGSGTNQFNNPGGVFIDLNNQDKIYISDSSNNRIVRIDDISGTNWTTLTSANGHTFSRPFGICLTTANPKIYVAEVSGNRIAAIDDMTGTNWTTMGSSGTGDKQFQAAYGVYCR
ncbi:MAG: SMP-30/gluconolactonase/LRE family protein [Oligoflexales bacterium]|nr:SMP-30/gluconolactonase/LRE family protein [Oligoflexales bacterium]